MYPLDKVSLPANPYPPKNSPSWAWSSCGEWRSYPDVQRACTATHFNQTTPVTDAETRRQRQAYFAAASYGDAQVGRVLDELDALGLSNNTIIVLFGDHGWHLGENNEWAKHTAMTRASHAPLLFSVPGVSGRVSDDFAEFVDIFPTLADLAGIPVPSRCDTPEMSQKAAVCSEGSSLKPLIGHTAAQGKTAAFGQWRLNGHMSYSLYTRLEDGSEVRYTEWVKYDDKTHTPDWTSILGRELYNRTADPDEDVSIHDSEGLAPVVKLLSARLHAGWRAIPPPTLKSSTLTV